MKPTVERKSKPHWLKKQLPPGGTVTRMERLVKKYGLNTVCHGAKCPNQNECYQKGTATFLILGHTCTRRCRFCSIPKGAPLPIDPEEPKRVAMAVRKMGLRYAVITSVTRDDLRDGGASHFSAVMQALKEGVPGIQVEVLVPDFGGSKEALSRVMGARPVVLNHNVETVPSLYSRVRPGADYERSLSFLRYAASGWKDIPAKSGLMVGLGETEAEIKTTLEDLRSVGVELITIGQYLKPAPQSLEVVDYLSPERFERYKRLASRLGFSGVAAGPFVRSSHNAAAMYDNYQNRVIGS